MPAGANVGRGEPQPLAPPEGALRTIVLAILDVLAGLTTGALMIVVALVAWARLHAVARAAEGIDGALYASTRDDRPPREAN
jgi:hypothetical protein